MSICPQIVDRADKAEEAISDNGRPISLQSCSCVLEEAVVQSLGLSHKSVYMVEDILNFSCSYV